MAKFDDWYQAVKARDCARLRQLVRGGIDINCRDSKKRTVLHHAAGLFVGDRKTHVMEEVIRTLVDLGADINACDVERKTPLHYSLSGNAGQSLHNEIFSKKHQLRHRVSEILGSSVVIQNDEQLLMVVQAGIRKQKQMAVELLVGLGADINARFDHSVTSLHRAIQLNNICGLETLLRLGVDVNAIQKTNCIALNLVLDGEQTTLLKHLVELGADVNSGYTELGPLLQAVELGRTDIIKILVKCNADVTIPRFDNKTPVIYAVKHRNCELVNTLAKLGADLDAKACFSSVVNEIVKLGSVDVLKYLFRHSDRAEALSPGLRRLTALGIAVMGEFHEMMACLLKAGAGVNARYDLGISTLVTAMRLGDGNMVIALATLEPRPVNTVAQAENVTALHCAWDKDAKTMELLLRYGADVNAEYDEATFAAHEAVKLGNGQMLRVLAELGADLNCKRAEGVTVIYPIIEGINSEKGPDYVAKVRLVVEAGLDLNRSYDNGIRPLHDAVILGDLDMVQILGELKADMNATKNEKESPVFQILEILRKDRPITDMIRYFAENGLDVNSKMTIKVTPLHDAVNFWDVKMAHALIKSGARRGPAKQILTILHFAISVGNNEAVKCLLECGADINAKTDIHISALHDAVEYSDVDMVRELGDGRYCDETEHKKFIFDETKLQQFTPIHMSIFRDQADITETLIKYGADLNCLQNVCMTPLDVALDQDKIGCAHLLMSQNMTVCGDTIGMSPLHEACRHGHIDLARLLIIKGSNVNKLDYYFNKPLKYLPLAKTADYHVLEETAKNARITEQVPTSFVSTLGCQDMTTSLQTPGIGDVRFIPNPSAAEVSTRVNKLLESITQQCKAFPESKLNNIGSSAEGTRVGLPNEMDFLFGVPLDKREERNIVDLGNGYVRYDYVMEGFQRLQQVLKDTGENDQYMFPKVARGSAGFHTYFIEEVMRNVFLHSQNAAPGKKVSVAPQGTLDIKDTDRKACSLFTLIWDDGKSLFTIPVDIVPALHIANWPEGATTRTWLMDKQELRRRGYVLVPKPPHAKSELAKECTEEELHTLWKISFPHLETEHMQRLEQRIKDVYITAKCLKNPDVCRIMITDQGSPPRNAGKYVTSYMLKMCFFQNVDYFREHHMSLEEMVCKVYDDLVLGLSKNFIPLFFLPNVSALSGVKVDVPKSAKVAKIMARFVRALYQRDCLQDIADGGDDQGNPGSVYRVYDISEEENGVDPDDEEVMTVYQRIQVE